MELARLFRLFLLTSSFSARIFLIAKISFTSSRVIVRIVRGLGGRYSSTTSSSHSYSFTGISLKLSDEGSSRMSSALLGKLDSFLIALQNIDLGGRHEPQIYKNWLALSSIIPK